MTKRDKTASIGLDVGGTYIKAGLVRADGTIVDKRSVETEVAHGVDRVIRRMATLVDELRQVAAGAGLTVAAVGLGMPGTLSRRHGVVIAPPNLDGWRNIPVVERLSALTGLRVVLDNDANLAALGEYRCGAGRGTRDMVMLTLGTGIGGGVIINGQLWHGAGENAGEFGHTIVHVGGRRCACGQLGCLEAYASAANTGARAAEAIAAGEQSSLKQLLDRGEILEAHHVLEAADAGDALARRVWTDTCRYLAVGCINVQCALDPERIVLAGGMSAAGDRLLMPVREAIAALGAATLGAKAQVCIAELGNDAGFLGAALAAFDESGLQA
jgi:glucokinase